MRAWRARVWRLGNNSKPLENATRIWNKLPLISHKEHTTIACEGRTSTTWLINETQAALQIILYTVVCVCVCVRARARVWRLGNNSKPLENATRIWNKLPLISDKEHTTIACEGRTSTTWLINETQAALQIIKCSELKQCAQLFLLNSLSKEPV